MKKCHKDIVKGRRYSKGKNLLGKIGEAWIEDLECKYCGSKSVRIL